MKRSRKGTDTLKRIMGHIGVFGGSLSLAPALQSLYAATLVKQVDVNRSLKRDNIVH